MPSGRGSHHKVANTSHQAARVYNIKDRIRGTAFSPQHRRRVIWNAKLHVLEETKMSNNSNPVILGTARTPFGKFGGGLVPFSAIELGGTVMSAAMERA